MKPITRRTAIRIGLPATLALAGIQPVGASLDGKGNDILTGVDETARLVPSGRAVIPTGHITCEDDTEIIEVGIDITQASTGARAAGRFQARCTGDTQSWSVRAPTRNGPAFEETRAEDSGSKAEVRAHARTRKRGQQTDEHTWWNRDVTLVED